MGTGEAQIDRLQLHAQIYMQSGPKLGKGKKTKQKGDPRLWKSASDRVVVIGRLTTMGFESN